MKSAFYVFLKVKIIKSAFFTLKQKTYRFWILKPFKKTIKADFIIVALFKGVFRWF